MLPDNEIKNLFPLFETKLLEDIEKNAAIREFAEGEDLMKIGQNIKSTILIKEGLVKVYREDEEGNEIFMYHLEPGQACALCQAARGLQAGGGNHLVGGKTLATFGGDAVAGDVWCVGQAGDFFHTGHLHPAYKTDGQVLPGLQHFVPCLLGRPARQRLGLYVQQGDAVATQGQVVGQLAANQAGTNDHHVFGT